MSFIQRFLRAWREARLTQAYDFISDGNGGLTSKGAEWTKEDESNALRFFSSLSGVRMLARLHNNKLLCAFEAARQTKNVERHCGIAYGAAINLTLIENHFASPPRSEDTIDPNSPSSVTDGFGIT